MLRVNEVLLCTMAFLLCFAICSRADWCVAQVGAPKDKLQAFVSGACRVLNCSQINPGGNCYLPNTIEKHSSYALDVDYKVNGRCNPVIGTKTITNPSYGRCKYP